MESLVSTLAGALKVDVPKNTQTLSEIRRWLRMEVNWLVERDHEKLKELLYRVDVDEDFLISALAAHPEEKVDVLTDLIISRQMQKMENKANNPQPPATDANEAL
jgi:hypothetical protein